MVLWVESLCVESTWLVPKPEVVALAALVPAAVESAFGATAETEDVSIRVVVVDESTVVVGVLTEVESVVVVVVSEPLLQAAKLPATAKIARIFFIVFN